MSAEERTREAEQDEDQEELSNLHSEDADVEVEREEDAPGSHRARPPRRGRGATLRCATCASSAIPVLRAEALPVERFDDALEGR